MNTSHHDIYQQGQIAFAQQLKDHLKKTRNLDIALQWGENHAHEQVSLFVEAHKMMKLTLNLEDIETFANEHDKAYQKTVLEKQERIILKRLQQKSDG